MIYGSSRDDSNQLRTFNRGQLKSQINRSGKSLLPTDDNNLDCRKDNSYKYE